jgi:hypothetical protein
MHKPLTEPFTTIELTSQASINQHKKRKKFVTEMPILSVINKVRNEYQENTSISVNIKQKVLQNSTLYSS